MNNRELAAKLRAITMEGVWSGDALHDAEHHPAATFSDRIVIRRYQHGIAKAGDGYRLCRIADQIESHA